ncbi:MAG TPA: methyltransferase domain-containing protein [Longimicrobiales bacterium]|nr:methyltransferase domain-containing protein [Longimicrobiales bacterium]
MSLRLRPRRRARSARALVLAAALPVAALPAASPLSAQLGSRPAEEWALVLESGRRLESLEIERVVAAIGLRPGDVVADIGAGTGIFSIPLARAVGQEGQVLSVEVDPGFLPMIERKAREQGVANVRTVLGEFTDPKLPTREVDVAFFHDVLHHIEDRAAYLRTLAGYLAPGGRIVVVDYDENVPGVPHADQPELLIGPDDVEGWMRAAGLELTRAIDMFDDKFFVIYTLGS